MSSSPVHREGQDRPLEERLGDIRLTTRQLKFVLSYVSLGMNGTKAAIAAGYSPKTAHETASQNLKKVEVKKALACARATEWAAYDALRQREIGIALEADIADYEPFLMGKAGLAALRRKGLDTRQVKSVQVQRTTTTTAKGTKIVNETRRIELYSAQEAARELFRVGQPDGGQPPQNAGGVDDPRVNLTLVKVLQQQFIAASDKPFVPGIPRHRPAALPASGGHDDHAGDTTAG